MRHMPADPIAEHLPRGEIRGRVLVVSDYRLLNLSHAAAVCAAGYAVYTAVTCTDVPRVFERFDIDRIDLIAFASLVHGWHHEEAEERPEGMPTNTDSRWQIRNILQVVEIVASRQDTPPIVLVATDLIAHECYNISRDALEEAGVAVHTYSASNPPSIVKFLQGSGPDK
ncbi:MAG: hypothetical protein ACOCZ7_04775 [Armatimonadota bacterium]